MTTEITPATIAEAYARHARLIAAAPALLAALKSWAEWHSRNRHSIPIAAPLAETAAALTLAESASTLHPAPGTSEPEDPPDDPLRAALLILKAGYESTDNPLTMYDDGMIQAAETVTSCYDALLEALDLQALSTP